MTRRKNETVEAFKVRWATPEYRAARVKIAAKHRKSVVYAAWIARYKASTRGKETLARAQARPQGVG